MRTPNQSPAMLMEVVGLILCDCNNVENTLLARSLAREVCRSSNNPCCVRSQAGGDMLDVLLRMEEIERSD